MEEYMLAYAHDNDVYTVGYDTDCLDILTSLVNNKILPIEETSKTAYLPEVQFAKLNIKS